MINFQLDNFNKLENNLKGIIYLTILYPFWYLAIYIFDFNFYQNNHFSIIAITAFCLFAMSNIIYYMTSVIYIRTRELRILMKNEASREELLKKKKKKKYKKTFIAQIFFLSITLQSFLMSGFFLISYYDDFIIENNLTSVDMITTYFVCSLSVSLVMVIENAYFDKKWSRIRKTKKPES